MCLMCLYVSLFLCFFSFFLWLEAWFVLFLLCEVFRSRLFIAFEDHPGPDPAAGAAGGAGELRSRGYSWVRPLAFCWRCFFVGGGFLVSHLFS